MQTTTAKYAGSGTEIQTDGLVVFIRYHCKKMQCLAALSVPSAHSSSKPQFPPSASDWGRRSFESGATWIEWQGIDFALDNHNSAVYALDIICCDFGDAIEAQQTMTTRPVAVIPKSNQTRLSGSRWNVEYVSKATSESRNKTGVADPVTFRTKTAASPRVGGRA
jgi:hypothetical protein